MCLRHASCPVTLSCLRAFSITRSIRSAPSCVAACHRSHGSSTSILVRTAGVCLIVDLQALAEIGYALGGQSPADEFVQENTESESLEAFRTKIREDMGNFKKESAERGTREQIISKLLESHDFLAPPTPS